MFRTFAQYFFLKCFLPEELGDFFGNSGGEGGFINPKKNEIPSVVRVWIFSGTTQLNLPRYFQPAVYYIINHTFTLNL